MAKMVNLNTKDGQNIYPKTVTDAVYDDTGNSVTEILTGVAYVSERASISPVIEKINADTLNGKSADYYATANEVTIVSNNIIDLKKSDESLSDRVTKNETDIKLLDNRINTIMAVEDGDTDGNTELLDIRVKTDGTTAATAGDAIREQFAVINNNLTTTVRAYNQFNSIMEYIESMPEGTETFFLAWDPKTDCPIQVAGHWLIKIYKPKTIDLTYTKVEASCDDINGYFHRWIGFVNIDDTIIQWEELALANNLNAISNNFTQTRVGVSDELFNINAIKCGETFVSLSGVTVNKFILFGAKSFSQFLTTDAPEILLGHLDNGYPVKDGAPFPIKSILYNGDQTITQECVCYLKNDGGLYLSVPHTLKSDKFNWVMLCDTIWGNFNH